MSRSLLWRILMVLMPILLAGFYFFLLLYQAERVAITDDARFYMDAARSYGDYLEAGWNGFKYFDRGFIDRYWQNNHEHPSFAKLLMAGGYLVHKKFGILRETVAYRVGISALAAVLLLFLFSFVRRAVSFRAAVFAALFFMFLPRTFFHARVATLDFTVGATCFIFVYCYWRGLTSRSWAWMTGVAFGFALASKLNAPFMVLPVLVHYCVVKWGDLKRWPVRTIFAPQFVSMLLLSLPVFFALWPWL
ncbi:MAG TPA: glycosyltransferase family 39 protein, partial [bacterium]|nr:glycosyltransferase family 39 protein [bacterium]